ncbi:hypothetical protein MAPG_08078 [Magnaporthiopsis poae ATCC 64411]|uniref:Uncharacterized protein n=1 Tax=Magnaporthiopsis poae (strain ATCC 64411 / 73-15) TaxID=644358 RepID=A0A0C4E6E4_MAGP6|nr:hypothetical protein MAPG_08078 [Magnaporthiopsis poae ATCC 64411]
MHFSPATADQAEQPSLPLLQNVSYHERFGHPWKPHHDCVCGLPREVGHTPACEIRRVPARWTRGPPRGTSRGESEWRRRGRDAVVRTRVEKAVRELGVEQLMFAVREGVEVVGRPQAEDPGDLDAEEELPVAEVGRAGTTRPRRVALPPSRARLRSAVADAGRDEHVLRTGPCQKHGR